MTAITIVREETEGGKETRFRATVHTGTAQAVGETAGEALDALAMQLPGEVGNTLVIVPQMRPDEFFSEAQICRLQELMERSHAGTLTSDEQAERDALIEAELLASAQRTAALADSLGR